MPTEPYIPRYITVHLGTPDSGAQNVTLSFPDYIKNVASSEIYPTWPENAIRANIYAQISFALNRIYTEWYRSRGYDFDITNSTRYDQAFVQNRDIFENISVIVDGIFNSYVRREGTVEPYFTQYCNGTTVTCQGLSQWGTVPLANQGYTPFEILQYYYGDDIYIVNDAPIRINAPSYPGAPVLPGSGGNDVQALQVRLNRISRNYPIIPKIQPVDGVFGATTEAAVRQFQQVFNLPVTGIVDRATWNKINYIYVSVKRLSELDSEGVSLSEASQQFPEILREGMTGQEVRIFQYYLAVIGYFYDTVPPIEVTGVFGPETTDAVIAFQKTFGLNPDGIVGRETWNEMYRAYRGIAESMPAVPGTVVLYPGTALQQGSTGQYVTILQGYLDYLSNTYPEIPSVTVDGVFGPATTNAVIAFQELFGLEPSGTVGPLTWDRLASEFSDLQAGNQKQLQQNPGINLGEGGQA